MDFGLSDEQQAVVDLARQILTDRTTPDRLRELEAGTDWVDRDLWAELAKADLLGLCLPEAHGGAGYGFLEACLILEAQGRTVAPLPLLGTLVGGLAIGADGTDALASRLLPGVAAGTTVLTLALAEPGGDPRRPLAVRAARDGDGWTLTGVKTMVPLAHVADAALVTAATDDGPGVFVVDLGADGITTERQDTFNHEPTFVVTFDGVAVPADDVLGSPGDGVTDRLADMATVGLCAITSGVSESALRITAEYTTTRKQFEKPIGSFQAVGQRMADAYVDNEAVRLTMLSAASRIADGIPAAREVAIAKFWAADGGNRVVHAGLHVHGGISIDLDYPIHRYFHWAKHMELQLGGASVQLERLGDLIAAG